MTELNEQLASYLSDAHSIEEQALAQLRSAPDMAGSEAFAAALREHLAETEEHERQVRDRLSEVGERPSWFKDTVMAIGGKGFVLFARSQPDTPGKLAAHTYSYEHLELASYELLARVARTAGDEQTEQLAHRIAEQERAMAERIEALFDETVEASLRELSDDDLGRLVIAYLTDAHALEEQSQALLERAVDMAGDDVLRAAYRAHLEQTSEQRRVVEQRLQALGESSSGIKDAAMKLGGINWSRFFAAHPDTPGKLLAFVYAFEHLEIAGYEQLLRVARRADDGETVLMVEELLTQERIAAELLSGEWETGARASLSEVGAG